MQRNLGAHRRLTLERELAESLIELARAEGATFYIATLAAFGAVLYRRSGADDIVIGSPIANRTRVELQPVIGFFSNTLVLRLRLGGNPSFRELLGRVRDTATRAYAHQELPFEKVVEAAAPRRNPGYNPLFQVNFRSQVSARKELSLTGLEAEVLDIDIGFSRFDLALELELRDNALEGYVEYDTDLFDAGFGRRFDRGHALAARAGGERTGHASARDSAAGPCSSPRSLQEGLQDAAQHEVPCAIGSTNQGQASAEL